MTREKQANEARTRGGAPGAPLQLPPDRRLVRVFGDPVPREELVTWAAMPKVQRDKALQRIAALDGYCMEGGMLTAKEAAADAGVKLGRFYQMARAWRERRSLASLGAFASATKPRQGISPHVSQALQAAVGGVVDAGKGASVARMARMLATFTGLSPQEVPSQNTLRLFVERELRRRAQAGLTGAAPLFDFCTTSLTRADGRAHVLFLLFDGGTGLILGQAVGLATASAAAYRSVCRDALGRIPAFMPPAEIWSDQLGQAQLVPGGDADAVDRVLEAVRAELGGLTPQLAPAKSPGSYIRERLGLKIGTVRLLPSRSRTSSGGGDDGIVGATVSERDAHARIEIGVAEHNDAVLAGLASAAGEPEPPGELVRLLELMAG